MPQLTLMIHTASPDDFLRSQGIPSYFEALAFNLMCQRVEGGAVEFELVYVDTYHAENRERFAREVCGLDFQIKHVPVHKDHRYWYDRGHCYIAAAKNTGILYADGELLVSCDDAEFFPDGFLAGYWENYRAGRYAHALHRRMRSIETVDGIPKIPPRGDIYTNDHRWQYVTNGVFQHCWGSSCFAGTSFSLGDALTLNGYNERMDGCKSLDDCDFGNRLQLLGRSFAMDPAVFAYIVDHSSYGSDMNCNWVGELGEGQEVMPAPIVHKTITNLIAVENHGMLRCGTELLDIVANKNPLTDQHMAIIREDTLKYRKFDPLAPDRAETLAIWLGTPTFNLTKQREELRRSPDWKWK